MTLWQRKQSQLRRRRSEKNPIDDDAYDGENRLGDNGEWKSTTTKTTPMTKNTKLVTTATKWKSQRWRWRCLWRREQSQWWWWQSESQQQGGGCLWQRRKSWWWRWQSEKRAIDNNDDAYDRGNKVSDDGDEVKEEPSMTTTGQRTRGERQRWGKGKDGNGDVAWTLKYKLGHT